MPPIHQELAAGRWFTLTLSEQLANIGSEADRTIRAAEAGDGERQERAFLRMLELLDLTLADQRWRGRYKEPCRLREILCDVFQGGNVSGTSFEWLSRHFLEYGIAARSQR
jgi:hypothetical protein